MSAPELLLPLKAEELSPVHHHLHSPTSNRKLLRIIITAAKPASSLLLQLAAQLKSISDIAKMSKEQPLASLSLTHVHYDPTDHLSYLCAWFALVPQGLCVVYATLLYTTREAEIILTFAGQLACEALNFALKRLFRQARPQVMRGKGYGMPSSHAQFAGFFAASVALFLLRRHTPGRPPRVEAVDGVEREGDAKAQISEVYSLQMRHPRLTRAALTLGAAGAAGVVAASRVYLSYHTPAQVLVGGGVGAAFAVAWFGATEWARRSGWVEWALELEPVRKARVRDLLCEEDLVEIGWQVWEEKRRRRRPRRVDAATGKLGAGKKKKG